MMTSKGLSSESHQNKWQNINVKKQEGGTWGWVEEVIRLKKEGPLRTDTTIDAKKLVLRLAARGLDIVPSALGFGTPELTLTDTVSSW